MNDKLEKFRARVQTEQAERHNRQGFNFAPPDVTIKPGKKYTKVDVGTSGKYMVTQDGEIFGIKAYGVIHRGKFYGTLDTIDRYFWGDYDPIKLNRPDPRKEPTT